MSRSRSSSGPSSTYRWMQYLLPFSPGPRLVFEPGGTAAEVAEMLMTLEVTMSAGGAEITGVAAGESAAGFPVPHCAAARTPISARREKRGRVLPNKRREIASAYGRPSL